jgi:replication-associated recombination protein RarA
MILKLLSFLAIILATWFILDQYYYSPKNQIKRLWNKVHKLSELINKLGSDYIPDYISDSPKDKINKIGKVINSLLDYHFDSEEDKEYIEENRYTDDSIKREEFIIKKANKFLIQEEDWEKIGKFLSKN